MLRILAASILALGLLLGGGATLLAQEEPRITETSIDPSSAEVGDRLVLTIVVEHAPGTSVEGPRFDVETGALDLLEIEAPETGERRTTLRYVLAAFETGRLELPPLGVRWRNDAGEGVLTTPSRAVSIESVLEGDEDELRPLKPQLAISEEAPPAVVPALFVAIFVVLTLAGYRLVRRAIAAPPRRVELPPAPLTADAAARSALDELSASGLAGRDVPEHYARLAEIVRRYLSQRFGFAAYAMTRTELEPAMRGQGIDRLIARVTGNLLEQSDAVVFAGYRPPPERVDADLTAAYEIVERTRPAPAGEEAQAV